MRLDEVATSTTASRTTRAPSWYNGTPAIYLAIQKQPGTNTVEVVDAVKALLPQLRAAAAGRASTLEIRSDRSQSIRESVHDVKFTLLLTVVLVVLVIFLFLRNLSATIIPSLALPVSIVATFAVMYLLGYSLDNLSLMALTLSVGFVVDDAIVMLENIVRHMEMGKPPMQAAFDGSKEIAFTIVSMTLSLAAVFIPVLFMGGIVGRLLHEFAVTIGVAILVSGFVSISLTPMLCSRFLKPPHAHEARPALQRRSSAAFDALLRRLRVDAAARRCASRRRRWRVSRCCWSATVYLFMRRAEGLPAERGHGQLQRADRGDQGIGFDEMVAAPEAGDATIVAQDPERRRASPPTSAAAAAAASNLST